MPYRSSTETAPFLTHAQIRHCISYLPSPNQCHLYCLNISCWKKLKKNYTFHTWITRLVIRNNLWEFVLECSVFIVCDYFSTYRSVFPFNFKRRSSALWGSSCLFLSVCLQQKFPRIDKLLFLPLFTFLPLSVLTF